MEEGSCRARVKHGSGILMQRSRLKAERASRGILRSIFAQRRMSRYAHGRDGVTTRNIQSVFMYSHVMQQESWQNERNLYLIEMR